MKSFMLSQIEFSACHACQVLTVFSQEASLRYTERRGMMGSLQSRTFAWLIFHSRVPNQRWILTGKWETNTKHCENESRSLILTLAPLRPSSTRFVLLVSGLGLGSSQADSMLGLQLLIDMVTGQLGDQGEQSGAATISRVLLAGNLLSHNTQDKDASTKVLLI